MTGRIVKIWRALDDTIMATVLPDDKRQPPANIAVPASAFEGQRVRLVDGVWRLIARAA